MRNIQNKGKEEGQTNESLNARAAHAADAARDAEAVDWKEAGGHPGGAGREREGGKGVRRLALCGGRAARPRSLRPLYRPPPPPCRLKPLKVTMAPSPGNQLSRSPKTINTNFSTVFSLRGRWLGVRRRRARPAEEPRSQPAHPPARPAPRRRTCDRCAGASHSPEPRVAPASPRPQEARGRPPRRRSSSRGPQSSAGRGVPPARVLGSRTRSPPALT